MWVFEEGTKVTRKFDGTAVAFINGEIYKRYDCKKGKTPPENAIPCQEPDGITGHWPHWVKCDKNKKEDQYFWEALFNTSSYYEDGTYELCGPKINGNKEQFASHCLIKHGSKHGEDGLEYLMETLMFLYNNTIMKYLTLDSKVFEYLKYFLSNPKNDIEGIVFHGKNGKMCKIRKCDFGIKR